MIAEFFQECVMDSAPSVVATAVLGLFMYLGFLTLTSAVSEAALPNVPKLKGYPVLGAIPIYFRDGMALLLETLTTLGEDGIAYAQVGNKTLVSVHDPVMAKEVLAFTDKIASRQEPCSYEPLFSTKLTRCRLGDPRVFSWSPFWTLTRLLDRNLFDDVGHEAMRQRGVYIREFNNPTSNVGKFEGVLRVATEHVKAIVGDADAARIGDIRHAADNFAATLWGDTLYGRSDALTDDRVMRVADEILRRAGSPWPSALYSFMLTFGLVEAGKPIPSEARIRAEIEDLYKKNVQHLENYERSNPDSPVKTIRSLSVADGGKRTGPLTILATQFARINVFGGHHSIGSNITWTLIELQKRPDVLAKLLAEIESIGEIDFTTVTTKMPYLNAIVMEINRLYPTVPATLRVIERETRLVSCKKPVVLKPGMLIYLSYLHMHTSPKYWGPTAGEFDPNRFLNGVDKSKPFMAFGSGTRDCVGYKFALLAVKVYLITLLQTYRFKVEEDNCTPKLNTLLETSGPVKVEFFRKT
ncbi:putative N-alkane-inducible cytochrome P450 [Macroventuria anomochaeta]|uniref:N-alkane-inducible cytochrome P450 n=1 Tax=Macroventuria anomochaeta TaxID=301207 RepID=A0ACB6RX75_9PLEO|nr:putative N-alkane-inducible cytochrome P450 [Macroventuria anomochaeta]KAF2626373.1 putative N-alkane-inducible cytochrome P450 [Macroventuria anomochaeta]